MKSTTYLAKNAGFSTADFMKEWKTLSTEDKEQLKQWAREECAALGVTLEDPTAEESS